MESAELKKKRIKRCYSLGELYHRFVHSDEYAYSPISSRNHLSCKGNYLVAGNIRPTKDMDEEYDTIKYKIVAIIDRVSKRIIINCKYEQHVFSIHHAVPNDYEIYKSVEEYLPKDCLSIAESYLKIHSRYLLDNFTRNVLYGFYKVLLNKSKVLHYSLKELKDWYNVNNIISFVKQHKLKTYDFYNQTLSDDIIYTYYEGWNSYNIKLKVPTLKQVITNTVFNKIDKLKLDQTYFYTKHCYGFGIPLKDVEKYWNKKDWSRTLLNKYNRTNVCVDLANNPDTTWNEYISKSSEAIINIFKNKEKEYRMKSEENRQKALQELTKNRKDSDIVNDWRERKHSCYDTVSGTYSCYFPSKRHTKLGVWKTQKICSSFRFNNIQLRLNSTTYGTTIQTSNHATVQLADTIKCWKLFTKLKSQFEITNKTCDAVYRLEDKNIKVGIYNLRSIKYCNKVTDNNKSLNYKDWVIIIGCHHIWLEEILDFIKYYHLEKEFNL